MQTTIKNLTRAETEVKQVLKKYRVSLGQIKSRQAFLAWQAMAGIWKNRKLPDAAKWQRKIRKEWERKIL